MANVCGMIALRGKRGAVLAEGLHRKLTSLRSCDSSLTWLVGAGPQHAAAGGTTQLLSLRLSLLITIIHTVEARHSLLARRQLQNLH